MYVYNRHLLDTSMEIKLEAVVQKAVFNTQPLSPVEQALFLGRRPPSHVRTFVTRPVG
jgi:hypothetical protein